MKTPSSDPAPLHSTIGPPAPGPAPLLVDARTAARLLSISSRKLWSLSVSGEIAHVRFGRRVLFDPADLCAAIDARKTGAAMSILDDFQRVSRQFPCPVCEHLGWCMVSRDDPANPSRVICTRVESPKLYGEAGFLHVLRNDLTRYARQRVRSVRLNTAIAPGLNIDFASMAMSFQAAVKPVALQTLADALGVSVEALTRLHIGWAARFAAWSFPMARPGGPVVGIRLRFPSGAKLSVKGGREGLFIPDGLSRDTDMLLVAEGPTDCAALLDLGYAAVGRPSCTGGTALLVELVKARRPTQVVVVADADTPGQRGAEGLAAVLVAYSTVVRIVTPPVKDARAWVQQGATQRDIQQAIDAAPARRLAVRVQAKAR